jgi:rhamnopyranosyl-N-acetylglucosaminyl-diphospho-decaprenol beta-1,3/1,4-galactofuranosyltransferase
MRVLAHIHTFNDTDFIEQALEALRRQTRQPDAIVIVDNASTDGTLDKTFPKGVAIVRNSANLGTSGAVQIGFTQALEQGFDWTWVLDPDSVPEPDALENLLAFFERLPPSEQERVCFLACRVPASGDEILHRPMIFTDTTIKDASADGEAPYTRCDYFIWSGCLFRMPSVVKIGLPSADYFTDLTELEYGYRARQLGFMSYIVNRAVLHQDVGRPPGAITTKKWNIGRFEIGFRAISPLRTYYHSRNLLYFWLYQCRPLRPRGVVRCIVYVLVYPTNLALRPVTYRRQLTACMRGLWDGLTGHIERRY